jgi:DNA-binding response OmpR family regulator
MKKRVLIVEDDAALARVLRDNFEFEGFEVEWVALSSDVLPKARWFAPDLILLDIILPGPMNGFDLCAVLRQSGRTPIIILTAKGQKADKLRGLNVGADDYVIKPFDLEELLARVNAVLRRARPTIERLTLGRAVIDFRARVATDGERILHLTHREFELLHYLAERPERVVFRDELLRDVWGYVEMPWTWSVDHAIARLRKKIEADAHHPKFIHTVHGDGYCLTLEGANPVDAGA